MSLARSAAALLLGLGLAACYGEGSREQQAGADAAPAATVSPVRQAYPNLPADVVFENDKVIAQRAAAQPGEWAGEHGHTGNQLAIALSAGEMTYREGGEDTKRTFAPGDVFWVDATAAHDHAITGNTPMDFVLVSMAPKQGMAESAAAAQNYPNAPADVVFENDRVIVQKLTPPKGWVGEHSHTGGQLVVVLKGGDLVYREGGVETPRTFTAGEVFMVEPTAAHDHMATSAQGVESILITMK